MVQSQTLNRKQRRALEKKNKTQAKTKMAWMASKDLKPGDKIVTKDGRIGTVTSVKAAPGLHTVHNFAVEDHHTYFVGDGPGVWVHNRYQTTEETILKELDITKASVNTDEKRAALSALAEAKDNPLLFGDDVPAVQDSLDFTRAAIQVLGGSEAYDATTEAYQPIYDAINGIEDKTTKLVDVQALASNVQTVSTGGFDPYQKLVSALSGAIDVVVGVGKTVNYIGEQIEKRPILKWALVGLDVAAGPVAFAVRTGLGKVFGKQINKAIGAATNGISNALQSRGIDPATAGLFTLGTVALTSLVITGSKFLRNGGIGKIKNFAKFAQLRFKFNNLANKHLLPKYRDIDPNLEAGMTGSFKTRKVGNPHKDNFGENVDLNDFDIDFWIKSDKLHKQFGPNLRADTDFRKILSETPGFEGLRPNKKGFSIKFLPSSGR